MKQVHVHNLTSQLQEELTLKVCDSFFLKLKGLMWKSKLNRFEGLFFVNPQESILDSSIHMFFVNFDIAVIWIDKSMKVVDKVLAKRWHPYYAPRNPAKYFFEIHAERFLDFSIHDLVNVVYD